MTAVMGDMPPAPRRGRVIDLSLLRWWKGEGSGHG
jgi:hypothetical protein